jgi:hypothetical protein
MFLKLANCFETGAMTPTKSQNPLSLGPGLQLVTNGHTLDY